MSKLTFAIALTGLVIAIGGCANKGAQVAATGETAPVAADATVTTTTAEPAQTLTLGLATQPADTATAPSAEGELAKIIYFETDSADVRADFQDDVEQHAKLLAEQPNAKIVLEGHADERGTREYNMALGERRAYAVKQMLMARGVAKDRIQIVSFGEEKPMADGHSETAWKENRRAVFVDSSN